MPEPIDVLAALIRVDRAPSLAFAAGALAGLKVVAVAVVAQAVLGMARALTPDARRAGIAVVALALAVLVGGVVGQFGAILLEMAASPVRLLAEEVDGAAVDEDAVTTALDAIFRGYPVGLPLN